MTVHGSSGAFFLMLFIIFSSCESKELSCFGSRGSCKNSPSWVLTCDMATYGQFLEYDQELTKRLFFVLPCSLCPVVEWFTRRGKTLACMFNCRSIIWPGNSSIGYLTTQFVEVGSTSNVLELFSNWHTRLFTFDATMECTKYPSMLMTSISSSKTPGLN